MQSILFIIPWLPYPLSSGGHQALFNGIASVAGDYDVYIAYNARDNEEYHKNAEEFLQLIPGVHLLPMMEEALAIFPWWYQLASKVKHATKKTIGIKESSSQVICNENKMCSWWIKTVSPLNKNWLEHIDRICSEHHFDIIQVEMPWMVSQILTLPKDSKKIFVHHELGFVKRELELKAYKNCQYVQACKSFADFAEIGLLNKYDAVVTLSTIDKEKLIDHGVTVPVYNSIATINKPIDSRLKIGDGKRLSFVGPKSSGPNYSGLIWFLENCWYRLLEVDNSYRLDIIGNWDKESVEEFTKKYPNITFLGFVEDLGAAIKGTVMIVPITVGSGIRMKILEASALGVPFVSTSVGAEGIPVEDGVNCYIADTPELFVDRLLKLRDTAIQKRFVENARKMGESNYSIKALRENRLAIYQELLS